MSIIIEIATQSVDTRSGTSKRTGQPYTIHEQEAYLHQQGKPYPTPMKLTVETNQANGMPMAYAPGKYALSPDSFYIDRFGNLAVKPVLIQQADIKPAQQPAKKTA